MFDTCHNVDVSGTEHKVRFCKSESGRERLLEARLTAVKQRAIAAAQRDRAAALQAQRVEVVRTEIKPEAVVAAPIEPAPIAIAIALSSGGLSPLRTLLSTLPPRLPAVILVAQHLGDTSVLPDILRRCTPMPTRFARAGETIVSNCVYVGSPGRHFVVNSDRTISTPEGHIRAVPRPSADWLFETVSFSYGSRAMAVVLSGNHNDGARGICRIRAAGGCVIAQDPQTCAAAGMPSAAIATGRVNQIVPPEAIAQSVVEFINSIDLGACIREWENPFSAL